MLKMQNSNGSLEEISADQEKRLEYTARQKALYDYNTYMEENFERGVEQGRAEGRAESEVEMVLKMFKKGQSPEAIAGLLDLPIERIEFIINNN